MGKLIDVNKWFKDTFPKADLDYSTLDNKKAYPDWSTDITGLVNILNDAESVDAIPKTDYEIRLKADMVAMLTEIQLEIEEMEILASITDGHGLVMREDITALIQEKIEKLKEQTVAKIIKENDNG